MKDTLSALFCRREEREIKEERGGEGCEADGPQTNQSVLAIKREK